MARNNMTVIPTVEKDPDSNVDWTFDWETELDGDTIAAVTFVVDSGLTKGTNNFTNTYATVWISGGTAGTVYRIVCRVTTATGRIMDKTLFVRVVAQE